MAAKDNDDTIWAGVRWMCQGMGMSDGQYKRQITNIQKVFMDAQTIELAARDWIRIAPAGKRQFFAANDEAICFACIQVKENSLESYTKEDAVIYNQRK